MSGTAMNRTAGRADHRRRSCLGSTQVCILSVLAAASCALGACSVLSSDALDHVEGTGEERAGVYYALPMGLIDVRLSAKQETAEFDIAFDDVKFVADPAQRYLMRYRPLPNYEDDVEIEVSDKAFLSKVWATTEDKTDEIIVEIARIFKGFGAFQVGEAPAGFITLATITVDPSEPARLHAAANFLNERARAYVKKAVAACAGAKTSGCERFSRLNSRKSRLIDLDVVPPEPIAETPVPDCSAGICYRVKEPYILEYSTDGVRRAKIVYLPNKAPLVEIDITRALFVSKIQKLQFDANGFLKQAYVEKNSELLAVSELPLNIINAISSTMPFRLKLQQKQIDLAEARAAEIDAKRKLAEQEKPPGTPSPDITPSPDKE
jgi:hypothetical protein